MRRIHISSYRSNACTCFLAVCAWEVKLTLATSSFSSSLQASENRRANPPFYYFKAKFLWKSMDWAAVRQGRRLMPDLLLSLLIPSGWWGKLKPGPAGFLRTLLVRSGWGNNDEVTFQSSLAMQSCHWALWEKGRHDISSRTHKRWARTSGTNKWIPRGNEASRVPAERTWWRPQSLKPIAS